VSFAKYAALVKNLRGVVIADLNEGGVWESVEWLVARFRYRDLGLPPSMLPAYRQRLERYLGGNPFRELVAPVRSVKRIVDMFSSAGVSRTVAEGLVYASVYVSPLIVVGTAFLEELRRLSVDRVLVCKEMDLESWRLHLRIADYVILDFYERAVDEALEAIRGAADVSALLGERTKRILADKKRFWRIMCSEGREFLLYVDNLRIAAEKGLLGRLGEDSAATLAIVPAVVIPPGKR